jgi:hypothetical protein
MAKSLLNNLLGRFGINLFKPITKIMDVKEFNRLSQIYKFMSIKNISKTKVIASYFPQIDKSIAESHNLDVRKLAKLDIDKETQSLSTTSVVISAAITAYGRIHLAKLQLAILKLGGKLIYSDTDSIVTNLKLPSDMISNSELGKLKLELEINKGIFIAGKTYAILPLNGDVKIKAKGVDSTSLTYEDFVNLLHNVGVITAKKRQSIID